METIDKLNLSEIHKWRASRNQRSLFPKGGKVMPVLKGFSTLLDAYDLTGLK